MTTVSSLSSSADLLINFASAHKHLCPLICQVTGVQTQDSTNDAFLYNTLIHHRIHKGSKLVLHACTNQLKVIATNNHLYSQLQQEQLQQEQLQQEQLSQEQLSQEQLQQGQQQKLNLRYYAIPLTYQGSFKISNARLNGMKELVEWSSFTNKHNRHHQGNRVKVAQVQNGFEGLKEGDVVWWLGGSGQKEFDVVEVCLEKQVGQDVVHVRVPMNLQVIFVQISMDSDKASWMISELADVVKRGSVEVEIVTRGEDHSNEEEDLPTHLSLITTASEPSFLVSELSPLQAVFHLPTRMSLHLKFLKQLPASSSPLLNKKLPLKLSMLDRCVENLEEVSFGSIMAGKQTPWNTSTSNRKLTTTHKNQTNKHKSGFNFFGKFSGKKSNLSQNNKHNNGAEGNNVTNDHLKNDTDKHANEEKKMLSERSLDNVVSRSVVFSNNSPNEISHLRGLPNLTNHCNGFNEFNVTNKTTSHNITNQSLNTFNVFQDKYSSKSTHNGVDLSLQNNKFCEMKTSIGEPFLNEQKAYDVITTKKIQHQNHYQQKDAITGMVGFDLDMGISATTLPNSSHPSQGELTIPESGNLTNFSVEMFNEFLGSLELNEEVILMCHRLEMDGRKFSRLNEEELSIIGLDQPVLRYFKKKTCPKPQPRNLKKYVLTT